MGNRSWVMGKKANYLRPITCFLCQLTGDTRWTVGPGLQVMSFQLPITHNPSPVFTILPFENYLS